MGRQARERKARVCVGCHQIAVGTALELEQHAAGCDGQVQTEMPAEWFVLTKGVGHGSEPGLKTIEGMPERLKTLERAAGLRANL